MFSFLKGRIVNPYSDGEGKSLSEIIESSKERHGTKFSREDFLRFERVTRDIMSDEMTDKDAREQATRHFFKRAQRQAMECSMRTLFERVFLTSFSCRRLITTTDTFHSRSIYACLTIELFKHFDRSAHLFGE
jgi:hypothetical protein